jgi:hypothetical protein
MSVVQPTDQGVIKLKHQSRCQESQQPLSSALDDVHFLDASWDMTDATVISNYFSKAGFCQSQ